MTRIDFHTNVSDKVAYACRLARKACAAQARLVMLAADAEQAAALNAALWTFSDTDFLPHVMIDDPLAARSAIVICADDQAEPPHLDMLVNLAPLVPSHFSRFNRVFEIISTDTADAAAGRQRYASYKQQSFPLTHFVAGKS